ncbi:MAG: glycosyltransferase [Candidatus Altiarchaeales archaeon]|nr:glycosyltransferase [Candidatus Altiarchaeales archaeon]MBD3415508.1 glycosyltransferase [Candidatus Altiarchaeales archaeon]
MMKVSVVVPTYNERENMEELVARVDAAMSGSDYEIVVVDDSSPDGTGDKVRELSEEYPVRLILRETERGLATAVVRGIYESAGDVIAVMDADLSHKPEYLSEMVERAGECDVVVGSRYVKGGSVKGWPLARRVISYSALLLAKPLTRVRDPVSGFFLFKREVVEGVELKPTGYKILLELLVKGNYERVCEVPIEFGDRTRGKSKITHNTCLNYLRHIMSLYKHRILGH